MNRKCIGCGAVLQSIFKDKEGYISEIVEGKSLCERCFKIKNYGECSIIQKERDFKQIINDVNKSGACVVYLVDILNITKESLEFLKYFKNNKFILLTKRDLLPKSVNDKKIIKYFKENFYDDAEVMCVSSFKKLNIDKFLKNVEKHKVHSLYIVGLVNSGKSSFINALMASIGNKSVITTSIIPNTTIDYIEIKLNNNLVVIDTPGFILKNSIYNYLNLKDIVKISPKKEIKVKTFQIKPGFSILVNNILRIDYEKGKSNSFSFYMSNNLSFQKIKINTNERLKVLPKKNINIKGKEDIVISGLGFIKIVGEANVVVYTLDENLISVRKNMI